MSRAKDMTRGNPTKLILMLALPLILANLGQQFYMISDAIIVGRGVGVKALASLGASDFIYWVFLWTIFALTQGFAVLITQNFGAGNADRLRKSIAMSVLLCILLGAVLTVIGLVFASPILTGLRTPTDIIDGAHTYLTIMFIGIPVVMAYNMAAAILRSFGDGKSPLIAIIIAAIINIGLDLLFVLVFGWGITGAAVASVIAQAISFLYCFYVIKKLHTVKLEKSDWQIDWPVVKKLCALGFPIAVQYLFITIGGIFIQFAVNSFGVVFVAGFTATNKLYGLLECSSTAFGFATATYMAQNLGANRIDRIEQGMRVAAITAALLSVVFSVVFILFGRSIVNLFVSGTEALATEAMDIAYQYLFVMCAMLVFLYLLHTYRSALQGLGNTIVPMIAGIIGFVGRVCVVMLAIYVIGSSGIYFAEPLGWLSGMVIIIPAFYREVRKIKATNLQNREAIPPS